MYGATNTDEVSITVIATGLQESGMKSVLPGYRPAAAQKPAAGTGTVPTAAAKPKMTMQPLPGLKSFKKPESTVEEQEIKIPQFFQKNR